MPLSQLPAFLLSLVLVGYSPGPCNIYALAAVLRHGRRRALWMWCGMLAGYVLVGVGLMFLAHYAGVACGAYVKYLFL